MWAAHVFWVHSLQTYPIHVDSSKFVEHVEHSMHCMLPCFRVKCVVIHRVTECVQLHPAHMTIEPCHMIENERL